MHRSVDEAARSSHHGQAKMARDLHQDQRHGNLRDNHPDHDDALLLSAAPAGRKEHVSVVVARDGFDLSEPVHKDILDLMRVGKSAILFCNMHGRLPSRPRDAHWFVCDGARGRSDFLTQSKDESYRGLNAIPVIAADTSGHRNIQRAA